MPASDDTADRLDPWNQDDGNHRNHRAQETAGEVTSGQDHGQDHDQDQDQDLGEVEGEVYERYLAAQDAVCDSEGAIAVCESRLAEVSDDPDTTESQRIKAREELAKAKRAFRRAGRVLEQAQAALNTQAALNAARSRAQAADEMGQGNDSGPPARFASVDLFVERFVLPNFVHRYVSGRVRWCAVWWEHAEAITVLEALWESFEVMRLEPPPSISTWLRDHFYVHMRSLTDPEGVFFACDVEEERHRPTPAWASAQPPVGMFEPIAEAQVQRLQHPGTE